jgi:hypothetical protein
MALIAQQRNDRVPDPRVCPVGVDEDQGRPVAAGVLGPQSPVGHRNAHVHTSDLSAGLLQGDDETVAGLFDCGVVDDAELAAITVQPEEVEEHRLVPLDEALELLRPPIRRQVRAATRHRRCVYLEDGQPVPGVS